jgi:hypothetical protein
VSQWIGFSQAVLKHRLKHSWMSLALYALARSQAATDSHAIKTEIERCVQCRDDEIPQTAAAAG